MLTAYLDETVVHQFLTSISPFPYYRTKHRAKNETNELQRETRKSQQPVFSFLFQSFIQHKQQTNEIKTLFSLFLVFFHIFWIRIMSLNIMFMLLCMLCIFVVCRNWQMLKFLIFIVSEKEDAGCMNLLQCYHWHKI